VERLRSIASYPAEQNLLEADMDPRDGYRRAAAECIEASRQTRAPGTRIELLVMALQFLELARAKLRSGRARFQLR